MDQVIVDSIIDVDLVKALKNLGNDFLNAKDYDRAENVHRLFQYPAMMVPFTQESIIKVVKDYIPEDSWVIDPFMGSSTSLLTCMSYGLNVYGQDINPLAVLLSKVKTGPLLYELYYKSFLNILEFVKKDIESTIEVHFTNVNKWFQEDVQLELSKLRRAILALKNIESRRFFWIALAETIRLTSNDRTSTYKLHARSQEEINQRQNNVIHEFKKIAIRNLSDLKSFKDKLNDSNLLKRDRYCRNVIIRYGDTLEGIKHSCKFNLLITSPPYGDNHTTVTYGQHAYLPLQWIPLEDIDSAIDVNCLRTTQEIDRQSLGGRTLKEIEELKTNLLKKSETLQKLFGDINIEEEKKFNKVLFFISEFEQAIDNMIKILNPNAYLIWTIGNRFVNNTEIQNDAILKELLEYKGLKQIIDFERDILNKRMPNRNRQSKTMSKERILIFRKPN